jgi:DNA-binding protein Fis
MMRNALCGVFVSNHMADEEIQRGSVKRQIARLIGNASVPIYILGDDDRIVFANDAFGCLLNMESDSLIGLDCSKNIPVDNSNASRLAAALALPPNAERFSAHLHPVSLPTDKLDRLCIAFPLDDSPRPMMFCAIKENRGEWEALLASRHRSRLQQLLLRPTSDSGISVDPWFLCGTSPAIVRTRKQLQIAAQHRFGVHVLGPAPSSTLAVAKRIAQQGCSHSPTKAISQPIVIECRLMDRDLLRGTLEMIDEQSRIHGKNDNPLTTIFHQIDNLSDALIEQLCQWAPGPNALLLATSASQDLIALHPDHSPWGAWAATLESHVVHVPALAQRLVDIEPLMVAWLDEFDAAMREATTRCTDHQLTSKDLSASIRTYPSHIRRPEPLAKIDLDAFLEQIERNLIQQALAHFRGNRTAAANHLGISRARFLRRLQQLGVEPAVASHAADSEELVFEEWTDDPPGQATEPEQ